MTGQERQGSSHRPAESALRDGHGPEESTRGPVRPTDATSPRAQDGTAHGDDSTDGTRGNGIISNTIGSHTPDEDGTGPANAVEVDVEAFEQALTVFHQLEDCTDEDCELHSGDEKLEHGLIRDSARRPSLPWWNRLLRIGGLAAIAVVMVIVLKGKLPSLADVGRALARAEWGWVLAAAVSLLGSIFFFSAQQRSLLRTFNVRVTHRRIGAITYASTALTSTLPAGGAVAAGYSYRMYRASGASRSTAATVMVLSGVLTISSLVFIYLAWLGISAARPLVQAKAHPIVTILVVLALAAVIAIGVRLWMRRRDRERIPEAPTPRLDRLEAKSPFWGRLGRDGLNTLRKTAHMKPKDWGVALGCSALKWLLDFFALVACCIAVDITTVSIGQLAAVFLGVQLVRQIPFTPGGIGLIEGALLTALVAAGAARGPAFAAILIYRILSAWILIPIGFALMAELKRRDAKRLGKAFV